MADKQYSDKFETYRDRFKRNGCTIEQIRKLVGFNVLKDWEFEEITGKEF